MHVTSFSFKAVVLPGVKTMDHCMALERNSPNFSLRDLALVIEVLQH